MSSTSTSSNEQNSASHAKKKDHSTTVTTKSKSSLSSKKASSPTLSASSKTDLSTSNANINNASTNKQGIAYITVDNLSDPTNSPSDILNKLTNNDEPNGDDDILVDDRANNPIEGILDIEEDHDVIFGECKPVKIVSETSSRLSSSNISDSLSLTVNNFTQTFRMSL